ncbi:MAG TPA: T9SS type A sorting domain-containing protein [Bacteroidia bacterium]|nr:T9SS type A sorting domain-containing protein [Bacteroidia bacterium]
MKKRLLSLITFLTAGFAFGQTIPNGGFENWTTIQYQEPTGYQTSNSKNNGPQNPGNVVKTTDAYHGSYAIQLNTVLIAGDTSFAYFANGDPGQNPPAGGIPYTQKPTGIRFYYKSNIIGTDSAIVLVMFKKAGVSIGNYFYKIGATKTAYTLFSQPFNLSTTPDSLVFGMASSNAFLPIKGNPGNMFQVDSISFTGVTQQPTGFNGDLELWQTHSTSSINGWVSNNGGDASGITQTTDKYTGTYAVELQTMGPSFGGSNQVQPGGLMTGNPVNNGPPTGGHPYTNQIDTLVFYYKYIPADPADSANVSINFSKNHVGIWGIQKKLGTAVGSYTMVKIPFNIGSIPDTAMINLSSSTYSTWPVPNSFVGSDFKVDNMYFTSQEKPVTNFSLPTTGCVGQPIQLIDSSLNMVTGWTWIMGGGTPSSSGVENPTVTYNTAGSHTISMIATNSFGNGVQVFKHITIYGLPTISANAPSVCLGTQATFTASGANTYTWSTGATTATISASPTVTTNYTVTGTDVNGCENTTQTSLTILTAPVPSICMVSADTLSVNNVIYWDKTPYANVDSFIAYREVSSNVYKRIGAQPYSALSQFIDTARSVGGPNGGNPNTGTYRYKLQTVDTCGNYSALSPYHNTIYITNNNNGQFTWATPYQIEGQPSPDTNYVLSCDTANTNVWTTVATVSGSQQTVADPGFIHHANIANWRVDALGFNCNPTLRLNGNNSTYAAKIKSHSNQNNNRVSGISKVANSNSIRIYPNPATNALTISFANTANKASVKIFSVIGSEVLSINQTSAGNSLLIDISNLASGTYMVQITTDNTTETKKIVKQ